MGRFTNKIVVITGGIGLAAARQFITEGATVIVIGRSPRSVGDAQKEIGANGIAIASLAIPSLANNTIFARMTSR
jgi:NADP-dependent 3-hydroxy acid dehydrogenase YdfG